MPQLICITHKKIANYKTINEQDTWNHHSTAAAIHSKSLGTARSHPWKFKCESAFASFVYNNNACKRYMYLIWEFIKYAIWPILFNQQFAHQDNWCVEEF